MPGPRDYKPADIKRLFAFSNNTCAHPDCNNHIIGDDKGQTVLGKICHIEAASKKGPRFNKQMSDEERRSFKNLILLCDEHHSIIDNKDNENEYPKKTLLAWKKEQMESGSKPNETISFKIIDKIIAYSNQIFEKLDSIEGQMDGPYHPIMDPGYLGRSEEEELIATLKEKKVLLLTGISFCGKSELAKHIAEHFQKEEGYRYKRVSNTRDASSFLESTQNSRLCLLEDPFGHDVGDENISELGRLRSLLNNLPSKNMLIVTSRIEMVLTVFGGQKLEDCKLNHMFWNDLTVQDSKFLLDVWQAKIQIRFILPENDNTVQKLLRNQQLLQPGQLDYLANSNQLKDNILTSESIFHMAQVNAGDIARSIMDKGDSSWMVLAILGLGATTIVGPGIEDLAYILQEHKAALSLRKKERFENFSLFDEKEDFDIPVYKNTEGLTEKYEAALDFLEERGFIVFQDEEYRFRHPQYREIGKALFKKLSSSKRRGIVKAIHNAITCLHSDVAFNTAQILPFVFETFSIEQQKELIKYANEVSELSIFPKVSDQTFLLVIQNFKKITDNDFDSEIYYRLQTALESSRIIFKEGHAYRYKSGVLDENFYFVIKDLEYDDLIQKLDTEGILSQQEIWKILNYLEKKHQSGTLEFLEVAINSNEVFIRTKAAFIIFRDIQNFHGQEIVGRILDDRHPSIRYYALKGFFQGMSDADDEAIIKIYAEKFKSFFIKDELFSIRASTLMSNFRTDYASDSLEWNNISEVVLKKWWYYWGEFFPVFMNSFPRNAQFFHAPRFTGTMNAASEHIFPEQAVAISESLISFAETNFKYRDLNNFEMHIIDFLIEATDKTPELRFPIFKKLISGDFPTAFIVYNYSWALSRENSLTDEEKQLMLTTIKSNRVDVRWIKAFLISDHEFPSAEFQDAIFGDPRFMEKPVEELVEEMPRQLLEDGITVFRSKNPAFVHIGYGAMSPFWPPVLKYISIHNLPIKYRLCVEEIIRLVVNGGMQEMKLWGDLRKLWKKTFLSSDQKDELLEWVKKYISICNFTFLNTGYVFEVMIDYYTKEGRRKFLAESIGKDFVALGSTSGQNDIIRILKHQDFYKEVLAEFPQQLEILEDLYKLKNNTPDEAIFLEEMNDVLSKINDHPIELKWIVDNLKDLKSRMSIDQENQADHFISEFYENSRSTLEDNNYDELPDWVYSG